MGGVKLINIPTPIQWIQLIDGADYVVTDSYHACLFSVMFHKKFYITVDSSMGNNGEEVDRVTYFLGLVQLSNRIIFEGKTDRKYLSTEDIDFTYADEVLAKRREASLKYLRDAICSNNKGEA